MALLSRAGKGTKRLMVLIAFLLLSVALIVVVDGVGQLITFPYDWCQLIVGVFDCPTCCLKFIARFPLIGIYVYWNVLGMPVVAIILLIWTVKGYRANRQVD